GLYAEVVRNVALMDRLRNEFKVNVVGPSTLAAFLTSLQFGFRTLAIEERSADVWTMLGHVKREFGQFGTALAKVKKKLEEASSSVAEAEVRTRAMGKELK